MSIFPKAESYDQLYVTHLDSFRDPEDIGREEVRNMINSFPGKSFLCVENPGHSSYAYGVTEVPEEHILGTPPGSGEPSEIPEHRDPQNIYFGGIFLEDCVKETIDSVHEEYGSFPRYRIVDPITLKGRKRGEINTLGKKNEGGPYPDIHKIPALE